MPIMRCGFALGDGCFFDGLAAAIYWFLVTTESLMFLYQHDVISISSDES